MKFTQEINFVSRLLGGGLLAAGVAGVVGVGVALLAANQGLVLDETAFPRIAQRFFYLLQTLLTTKTFSVRSRHQDIRNGPTKERLNGATLKYVTSLLNLLNLKLVQGKFPIKI